MAKSTNGISSLGNIQLLMCFSSSIRECSGCGLKIEHLDEIFLFILHDHLEGQKDSLEFVIRDGAVNQCRIAKTGINDVLKRLSFLGR